MKSKTGFTLIEVMISVVILSIGLSVVLRSFLQCLNAIAASRNYMISAAAAKTKMDGIMEASFMDNNTTINMTSGTMINGSEILGGRNFNWQITMNASQSVGNFTDAGVTYSWKEGVRSPSVSCHMYFPQPQSQESGK
jgi:prepilin-type N-terminal cleavage/methylation domain-containing protein